MIFSLLDPEQKRALVFPVAPSEISIQMGTRIITVSPLDLGDVEFQRGRQPIRFNVSGMFPGTMRRLPGVSPQNPDDIVRQIKAWQSQTTGKMVRMIVTGTQWNIPVRIVSFDPVLSGGHGDINYTMSLSEWRDLIVKTAGTATVQGTKTANRPSSRQKEKTYTVKSGDSLWKIAQRLTGNGGRWPEMWAINKSRSRSKNPDVIYPGEVFLIPPGW